MQYLYIFAMLFFSIFGAVKCFELLYIGIVEKIRKKIIKEEKPSGITNTLRDG